MQIIVCICRATASKLYIIQGTRTPRPRAVWHKLYDDATHMGDVKRKVGVHSTLSTCGVPISPWAKWGAFVATTK